MKNLVKLKWSLLLWLLWCCGFPDFFQNLVFGEFSVFGNLTLTGSEFSLLTLNFLCDFTENAVFFISWHFFWHLCTDENDKKFQKFELWVFDNFDFSVCQVYKDNIMSGHWPTLLRSASELLRLPAWQPVNWAQSSPMVNPDKTNPTCPITPLYYSFASLSSIFVSKGQIQIRTSQFIAQFYWLSATCKQNPAIGLADFYKRLLHHFLILNFPFKQKWTWMRWP